MFKKITAGLLALMMVLSLFGCTPKAGEWALSDFIEIMQTEAPHVAALFPTVSDDSSFIAEQYITYDTGQFVAYLNVDFSANGAYAYETEKARLEVLVADPLYADDAVMDSDTVEGAVKYSLAYSQAVEAFMFDSGLVTYALAYEEEQRIVYVAVSENPLYTYSQFVPEPYFITDDLKASAEALIAEMDAE